MLLAGISTDLKVGADTFVFLSEAGEQQIVTYRHNEQNGQLTRTSEMATEGEPGFLAANRNGPRLFAAYRSTGDLTSYQIDPKTGALNLISKVPAGAAPAYVALDRSESFLMSAYYRAGKVGLHRIGSRGELSAESVHWSRTNLKAHAILTDPGNQWALAPHTGPNAVYIFSMDAEEGTLLPSAPPLTYTGTLTGPRHLQFHPSLKRVYFNYEQGSAVAVFEFDDDVGQIRPLQTLSTLPSTHLTRNSCADLEITPDGRFLYSANRGHDSIAGFRIHETSGKLEMIATTPTEKTPRCLTITDSGAWLIAAGQDSDHLQSYRIHPQSGTLDSVGRLACGRLPWALLAVTPRSL